jgi:DNA-binding MarR family transcriptional regulator
MQPPPSVRRLTQVLGEIFARMHGKERMTLARAGLSRSQARVLSSIAAEGETRLSELCTALGMSKSTVSSALDHLERSDLVVRSRRTDDRRVYPIRLTERGRALVRRIRSGAESDLLRAAMELTPYQRKTLASALGALHEGMTHSEEDVET